MDAACARNAGKDMVTAEEAEEEYDGCEGGTAPDAVEEQGGPEASPLMAAWEVLRGGLMKLAAGARTPRGARAARGEEEISAGLEALKEALKKLEERAGDSPGGSLPAVYSFPRLLVGRQLHKAIRVGTRPARSPGAKAPLVEAASRAAMGLVALALTPQERALWDHWRGMELEQSVQGSLGQDRESFGKHLHLQGGAAGKIQVMQDWEWPYMYALADLGFELALANGPPDRALRILEIGWGQGISGRRLMEEAERTGAERDGLRIEYEVIELHPRIAEDARAEASRRPEGPMRVHEGAWQEVAPGLRDGAYDLIFYDAYHFTPDEVGEKQLYERWGLPIAVLDNLLFYRLLRKGGVVVQYALSHGRVSASEWLRRHVAPLFSELRILKVEGLKPEDGTNYASRLEARSLEVPALVK